jgi:hypothetical protein
LLSSLQQPTYGDKLLTDWINGEVKELQSCCAKQGGGLFRPKHDERRSLSPVETKASFTDFILHGSLIGQFKWNAVNGWDAQVKKDISGYEGMSGTCVDKGICFHELS